MWHTVKTVSTGNFGNSHLFALSNLLTIWTGPKKGNQRDYSSNEDHLPVN